MSKKICVIGAGPMGLALAYDLLKQGCSVDIFEQDDRVGGMSASFDFDGTVIERYYHFICGPDVHTFRLLKELNLMDELRWSKTKMGFYYNGAMYRWGDPAALLSFPHLSLAQKIRYGLFTAYASSLGDLSRLDDIPANDWIIKWIGHEGFEVTWKFLMDKKLFDYAGSVSAAWIASRIRRVAKSRKNIFTETMGYIQNGTETMLQALKKRIYEMRGNIFLNSRVEKIEVKNNRVRGVRVSGAIREYDIVASTIPLPYLPALLPGVISEHMNKIAGVHNIGVVCTVLKLNRPLSDYFWINTNDRRIDTPGIIEYSNLRPFGENAHIVYIPSYIPRSNEKWRLPEEAFIEEAVKNISLINPDIEKKSVLTGRAFRYEYAQPIFFTGFPAMLPERRSGIAGLYAADTSHSYPEDRSIQESVRIAGETARIIIEDIA